MTEDQFKLPELIIDGDGLVVFHNQRCGIYTNQKAVFNCNKGYFEPSWKAQNNGWKIIKINTWFQKLLYNLFFKNKRD